MNDNIRTLLSEDIRALRRLKYIIIFIFLLLTSPLNSILCAKTAILSNLILYASSKNILRENDNTSLRPVTSKLIKEKYLFVYSTYIIISTVIFAILFALSSYLFRDNSDPQLGLFFSPEFVAVFFLTDLGFALSYFSVMIPYMLFRADDRTEYKQSLWISVAVFFMCFIGFMSVLFKSTKEDYAALDGVYRFAVSLLIIGASASVISFIFSLLALKQPRKANGMKALLYKDIRYICSPGTAILYVIYILLTFSKPLSMFKEIIVLSLVLNTFSNDISSKWPHTSSMLPYSKELVTAEKYIFSLGMYLVFVLPSFCIAFINNVSFSGRSLYFSILLCDQYFFTMLLLMAMTAVIIPLSIFIKRKDVCLLLTILSCIVFIIAQVKTDDIVSDHIDILNELIAKLLGIRITYVSFFTLTDISKILWNDLHGYFFLGGVFVMGISFIVTLMITKQKLKKSDMI